MDKGMKFLERLTEDTAFAELPVPGQTIVEIAGEHRVLVENHFGICAYSNEKIVIKVKFGLIIICGCDLELMKMSKGQLVIRGRINGVMLQRRG